MKLFFRKTHGGDLVGVGDKDARYLARLKPGETIEAEVRRNRNAAHHRKLEALISMTYENQETYPTREHLVLAMKRDIGCYRELVMPDGEVIRVYESRSFEDMDQDRFETEFYPKALRWLADTFGVEHVVMEADESIAAGF
jgi:hypothetical protein